MREIREIPELDKPAWVIYATMLVVLAAINAVLFAIGSWQLRWLGPFLGLFLLLWDARLLESLVRVVSLVRTREPPGLG